jgi:hypothetical protein
MRDNCDLFAAPHHKKGLTQGRQIGNPGPAVVKNDHEGRRLDLALLRPLLAIIINVAN